jgi:hypothetical protein
MMNLVSIISEGLETPKTDIIALIFLEEIMLNLFIVGSDLILERSYKDRNFTNINKVQQRASSIKAKTKIQS